MSAARVVLVCLVAAAAPTVAPGHGDAAASTRPLRARELLFDRGRVEPRRIEKPVRSRDRQTPPMRQNVQSARDSQEVRSRAR